MSSTAVLLIVIVGLGGVAAVVTHHVQRLLEHTAADLEAGLLATVAADRAHNRFAAAAPPLLYGLGEGTREDKHAAFEAAASEFESALVILESVVEDFDLPGDERDAVMAARESWQATLDGVAVGASIPAAELEESFAVGRDPFQLTVWEPYGRTDKALSDLVEMAAVHAAANADAGARAGSFLLPAVVASIAIALAIAALSHRQASRHIVAPLLELRRRAVDLTDADGASIRLQNGVVELRELGDLLAESADAVRASSGLLREKAMSDGLTGLPNRGAFRDEVERRLGSAPNRTPSVLFVDLDDFKVVNDSFGHAAGDELLVVVAQRLSSAVGPADTVARLGGDEFAIVVDDEVSAMATAEVILAAFTAPVLIAGSQLRVACSIGIASANSSSSVEDLVRQADFAMYMAKGQGKNRFELFSEEMHEEVAGQAEFRAALRESVARDELVLHYQPAVALASGEIVGFEALLRWDHPTLGLLSPARFIDVAEADACIVEIGAWAIDTACRDLAAYLARTDVSSSCWVSVNVATRQLEMGDLVATVRTSLERYGVAPTNLVLEVTEAAAIAAPRAAERTLEALRELGVAVALDDFGTGFSSLRRLQTLPVDILKIDRSFTQDHSDKGTSMLEMLVRLAGTLGLAVVAEGTETAEDTDRLRRFDDIVVQGYYFAHPAPADFSLRTAKPAHRPADTHLAMR